MEIDISTIVLLCVAAFLAGFVDAIVGGGGLIQTPAALILLPGYSVAAVLATVKIPSFCGTAIAAQQYIRKVPVNWKLITALCTTAFFASYAGSQVLLYVRNDFMKPVLLVVLFVVAIYTYTKKNFGEQVHRSHTPRKELILALCISLVIGFYDGFIGPGTGSFFILTFIAFLGFDFLRASASAKLVNLATNLGSITLFIIQGKIVWALALPMALSNAAGGAVGARLAIAKGNRFIKMFFLFIVIATLLRFLYDVIKTSTFN